MKRIYILIILLLLSAEASEAKKIEGRIFFQTGAIDVMFTIPVNFMTQEVNFEKLQYKVKYVDAAGKKQVLKPDEAQEIRFDYFGEEVRMVSRFNSLGLGSIFSTSSHIFLKIEIDKAVKLYHYYDTKQSPGMYNPSAGIMMGGFVYSVDRYILQKGNGELKRPKSLTFRKDMSQYFSDCPELVQKIEGKDFRNDDLVAIVEFYNSRCR